MSEINFSVVVDLSHFYQDHRKLARIFIKSGYKSIADVHNRISKLFEIDNFYLTADGQFLPLTEDIRILKSDEKICVNSKPKKRKKHHVNINDAERRNVATLADPKPVEKVMEHVETGQKTNKSKRKKEGDLSPSFKPNCESDVRPIKKLKPSSGSPEDLQPKTTLPKLQEQKPDTVKLSRLTDTPTSYQLRAPLKPCTSQYLAEKKVNVVQIEVVNKASQSDAALNSSIEYLSLNDTPIVGNAAADENSSDEKVRTVNRSAIDQKEASNYTKIFLDQKVANTPLGSAVAVSIENNVWATDLSLVTSTDASNTNTPNLLPHLSPSKSMVNDNEPKNPSSNKTRKTMILTGVGALMQQMRSGCSTLSDCSEDLSESNVTKRKRIRKRKRQNKKETKEKLKEDFVQPLIESTPLEPKPNFHIKFSSDEFMDVQPLTASTPLEAKPSSQTNFSSNEIMEEGNCQNHSTEPETERKIIQNLVEINKDIMGDENMKLAPLMDDKIEPKPGDIIAFKILKLTNNYAPEISDTIIGSVQTYTPTTKTILFKILRGHKELEKPTGKLTVSVEKEEEEKEEKDVGPKFQEFVWAEILEPKLLYP